MYNEKSATDYMLGPTCEDKTRFKNTLLQKHTDYELYTGGFKKPLPLRLYSVFKVIFISYWEVPTLIIFFFLV